MTTTPTTATDIPGVLRLQNKYLYGKMTEEERKDGCYFVIYTKMN